MKTIDLTPILQAVIMLLAALVTHRLIPWIRTKVTNQQFANLEAFARTAVYAAEQMFSSGENSKKLSYAVDQIVKAGFDLNVETIRAAVEQAVYDLKVEKTYTDATRKTDKSACTDEEDDTGYHIPALEDWPLEMIVNFCEDNNIECSGCVSKIDYIDRITSVGTPHPPDDDDTD